FFIFNILDFQDHQITELKKFTKAAFSLDDILTTASTLKYTGAIKKVLDDELTNPSEAFVRFFAAKIFDGRLTKPVVEQFTPIVKEARKQFINERINERLTSALSAEDPQDVEVIQGEVAGDTNSQEKSGIITTEEEIEGFHVVKAILRQIVDVSRITMRDTKSYCGILLDDNNRKPICRLHFNHSQKYLGVFSQKTEERIAIDSVDDLYKYSEQMKNAVKDYEKE
ncbi:MAG: restriction endonuclease, partial [Deltaproteobacteria bacterium]